MTVLTKQLNCRQRERETAGERMSLWLAWNISADFTVVVQSLCFSARKLKLNIGHTSVLALLCKLSIQWRCNLNSLTLDYWMSLGSCASLPCLTCRSTKLQLCSNAATQKATHVMWANSRRDPCGFSFRDFSLSTSISANATVCGTTRTQHKWRRSSMQWHRNPTATYSDSGA